MASTTRNSLLSLTLCVFVLCMVTTSVLSDHTNAHCFHKRAPSGRRGKCWGEIHVPDNWTFLDRKECCRLGGRGWSEKSNGKSCLGACSEEPLELVNENVTWSEADNVTWGEADNVTWSEWGLWSNCSARCGLGNVTRRRTCLPESACNGTLLEVETKQCDTNITCLVHGGWTGWSEWSECDPEDPCNAMQTSTRTCSAPPPANGGRPCRGTSTRTRPCNRRFCVAEWSEWSQWSSNCENMSCGTLELRTRERTCPDDSCPGNFLDIDFCQAPAC